MSESKSILLRIYENRVVKDLRLVEFSFKLVTLCLTILFWLKGPYKIPEKE
jgi:hypothetical protein